MITLKCQCCGIEQTFENREAAFQAGWDAPPHFMHHICCGLCPVVCLVLGESHKKAHEYWAEHGRPTEFNHMCLPDQNFGKEGVIEHAVNEIKKMLGLE
jgi:hypothetical protein